MKLKVRLQRLEYCCLVGLEYGYLKRMASQLVDISRLSQDRDDSEHWSCLNVLQMN